MIINEPFRCKTSEPENRLSFVTKHEGKSEGEKKLYRGMKLLICPSAQSSGDGVCNYVNGAQMFAGN